MCETTDSTWTRLLEPEENEVGTVQAFDHTNSAALIAQSERYSTSIR